MAAAITITVTATAGPVYQPPGANLTYGDVTHGQRTLSAAGNPAAAAADLARDDGDGGRRGGVVVSTVAGIEYGNFEELFNAVDELSQAFAPSNPRFFLTSSIRLRSSWTMVISDAACRGPPSQPGRRARIRGREGGSNCPPSLPGRELEGGLVRQVGCRRRLGWFSWVMRARLVRAPAG